MDITVDTKKQIEQIISGMECRKDFRCYKSGFKDLTKVQIFNAPDLLKCLGDNPQNCEYASAFGDGHYCKCPVRLYIAKNLKK